MKDPSQPIGIFGHYDELVIEFKETVQPNHVWAQDLLANTAIDIKKKVTIQGNSISIPGELIERVGTSAGDKGDISVPGLVLKLSI